MVALISRQKINLLNIDSVERAIVFAALILKSQLAVTDKRVTIDVDFNQQEEPILLIKLLFPFNHQQFNSSGGLLLESLGEISLNTIEEETIVISCPASISNTPVLPYYNSNLIDSFEKFLVFYSFILWASLENQSTDTVKVSFRTGGQIKINIELPLDLNIWLLGKSYLEAVLRVTEVYLVPEVSQISFLGNNTFLGNNNFLGN